MSDLDVGHALGKQVGPFPVGVWLVIVGGGLWFSLSRGHSSDAAPAQPDAPDAPDVVASPDYAGGGGGGFLPGSPIPTGPTTPVPVPVPSTVPSATAPKARYTVPAGGMSVWDAARKFLPWMPLDKGATTMLALNPSSPAHVTHRFYGGESIRVQL